MEAILGAAAICAFHGEMPGEAIDILSKINRNMPNEDQVKQIGDLYSNVACVVWKPRCRARVCYGIGEFW